MRYKLTVSFETLPSELLGTEMGLKSINMAEERINDDF